MTDPILIYFATLALIVWIAHAIDASQPTQSGDGLRWRERYDGEIEHRQPTNYDGLPSLRRRAQGLGDGHRGDRYCEP